MKRPAAVGAAGADQAMSGPVVHTGAGAAPAGRVAGIAKARRPLSAKPSPVHKKTAEVPRRFISSAVREKATSPQAARSSETIRVPGGFQITPAIAQYLPG